MPRLSEQLRKDFFLESLRKRVRHLYIFGESHPEEKELIASKLEGFLEAGLMLRICSRDEVQRLIDQEHRDIFDLSRAERIALRRQQGLMDVPDWTPYESPATERISSKGRRPKRYGPKTRAPAKHRANTKPASQING